MQRFWAEHRKSIVAVVLAAAYAVQAALSDDKITGTEWVGIGTAVLTAIGVYFFKNEPKGTRDTIPMRAQPER
jgi:hypothetical protein